MDKFTAIAVGKPFAVRRGTMFYGLRTDINKVVDCLCLLAGGMSSNEVCRQRGVTGDSLRNWVLYTKESGFGRLSCWALAKHPIKCTQYGMFRAST